MRDALAISGLKFIAVPRNTRLPRVSAFHAFTSPKSPDDVDAIGGGVSDG
jgi:hypothetical protein